MRGNAAPFIAGLLTFALLVGAGGALAADQPNDEATGTLGATVVSDPPEVTDFRVTNDTDDNLLHTQLDVNTTYFFNVTVSDPDGWPDIEWISVRIWYDAAGGTAWTARTESDNYRVDLNYTGDLSDTPDLTKWSVSAGNLEYDSGNSSFFENVANENYTFKLAFRLEHQIRQAAQPTASDTGYTNANSWNAEVAAHDGNATTLNRQNATTNHFHEFGVFQFTSVSIAANWNAGDIAPGVSGTTDTVAVTHQSNRAYNLTVWFDSHLTSNGNTIEVQYINITAAGDANDDIETDTSFTDIGIGNAVTIRAFDSNGTHEQDANETITNVQFRVFVPFGTPTGTYEADLTIRVEQ